LGFFDEGDLDPALPVEQLNGRALKPHDICAGAVGELGNHGPLGKP
jgi:hypothetical protein